MKWGNPTVVMGVDWFVFKGRICISTARRLVACCGIGRQFTRGALVQQSSTKNGNAIQQLEGRIG